LWFDGAGQRANLSATPSGVFRVPETAPSGTGLAGMDTIFIGGVFRQFKRWQRVPSASF
jgi:hypothetical protein